jgi:hypothetical protein
MRTLEQINTEYNHTCAQLGECYHRLEKEIPALASNLRDQIHELAAKIASLKEEAAEMGTQEKK